MQARVTGNRQPGRRALAVLCCLVAAGVTSCATGGDDPAAGPPSTSDVSVGPTGDPSTTDPGVWVSAEVSADGLVTITERVNLQRAVYRFTVSTGMSAAAQAIGDFDPRLRSLRVSAPGQQPREVPGGPRTREITFSSPVKSVELQYELVGSTHTAEGSTSGRQLVLVTALDIPAAHDLPQTISVPQALNLGCAEDPEEFMACGAEGDGGWSVRLAADESEQSVFAQVNAA